MPSKPDNPKHPKRPGGRRTTPVPNTGTGKMTFGAYLHHHAKCDLKSVIRFLSTDRSTITYTELERRVSCATAGLLDLGVLPGNRVALGMACQLETIVMILALFRCRATLIPLAYRPGLRYRSAMGLAIMRMLTLTQPQQIIVPTDSQVQYGELTRRASIRAPVRSMEAVAATTGLEIGWTREAPWTGPAIMQMSSGSTGHPKVISLSEANLLSNVRAISTRIDGSHGDRVYSWLPLHHDMGLVGAVLTSLYVGASLTLQSPTAFIQDPVSWLRGIAETESTVTMGPPSAYALVLEKIQNLDRSTMNRADLRTLRVALVGAEAVRPQLCATFESALAGWGLADHTLQPCYGLAENCVAVTMRPPGACRVIRHLDRGALIKGNLEVYPRSQVGKIAVVGNGFPVDGTEVRIGAVETSADAVERIGEVFVRGTSTAISVRESDAQNAVGELSDGWVPTGDLGAWLSGELFIIGRTRDIIKRAGEMILPMDIEEIVLELISGEGGSVAAVSVSDPVTGREGVAIVIEASTDMGYDAEAKIRLGILAIFQLTLAHVMFVRRGVIPRTLSGKIRRREVGRLIEEGSLAASRPTAP